jgi:hypothetical protein
VPVHVFLESGCLNAGPELFLAGFYNIPAHHLQTFIEIFEWKYDASARSERLNFAASISQSCQELLDAT